MTAGGARGAGEGGLQADEIAEGVARLRRVCAGAPGPPIRQSLAVAQLELLAALAEHPGARPASWPGC